MDSSSFLLPPFHSEGGAGAALLPATFEDIPDGPLSEIMR